MLPENQQGKVQSLTLAAWAVGVLLAMFATMDAWLVYQTIRNTLKAEERKLFRPVLALDFEEFTCDGPDLIVRGWLMKNEDDEGRGAKLTQLLIYARLPRRDFVEYAKVGSREEREGVPEEVLRNRTPGFQYLDLRLYGLCLSDDPEYRVFELHTEHTHPADPSIVLFQGWGPFNIEAPDPRVLY